MTRKNRPDAPTQSALYAKIKDDYNFDEKLVASTDYFLVDHIDGIDYYSPNDEDWGLVQVSGKIVSIKASSQS